MPINNELEARYAALRQDNKSLILKNCEQTAEIEALKK
jgi:hypothetical protein